MTDAKHPLSGDHHRLRTVKLSERDVDDARRLLRLLVDEEEQGTVVELARLALGRQPTPQERLERKARQILLARSRRTELFGKAMFGEPAWEMLLLLYVTSGASRQTVSRLAQLSGASKATALRWMDYLSDRGLIARCPHPNDARTAFVNLTDQGREMLEAYLKEAVDLTD